MKTTTETANHAALLSHEATLVPGLRVRVTGRGRFDGETGTIEERREARSWGVVLDDIGICITVESRNLEAAS